MRAHHLGTDPAAVADRYFTAWKGRDFATLRSILADDVTFDGPFAQLDTADACVAGLRGMSEIVTDIRPEAVRRRRGRAHLVRPAHLGRATGAHSELEPRREREDHEHPGGLRPAPAAAAR